MRRCRGLDVSRLLKRKATWTTPALLKHFLDVTHVIGFHFWRGWLRQLLDVTVSEGSSFCCIQLFS